MLSRDVLAASRPFAGVREFLRAVDAQQTGTVRLGDDARSGLGKNGVAVSVIAVMMGIKHVADRLIVVLLDRLDDVARLLRESWRR